MCPGPAAHGEARCFAHVRTDAAARSTLPAPAGGKANPDILGNSGAYDPSYLQSAYNLASAAASAGAGRTVAIVDAFDAPNAESDLGYYRSYFGLPACTTGNGCFKKVNQSGQQGNYPPADAGWAQEISLDVDMVSAICPRCNILLVEASSNNFTDLATAVDYAASVPGVVAIGNSYGGGEWSGETSVEGHYHHPGIAVTVSSGDNGYGVEFPAASQYVTAVGGTTLSQATNTGTRNATETVWSGAGSGCSAYEPKPTWQHDAGCARRSAADTSAVADPNTGVWVRYSNGWYVFGGTSVAAPIVASIYALAGDATGSPAELASYLYANPGGLYDITSGSNGNCGTYLCTGGSGYDGPTGLGTANGTTAFSSGASSVSTPDFSLAASPSSQTVVAGNSTSYSVALTTSNGYNSNVALSVSGQPSGATAGFTPTTVSPTSLSSTLSISTSSATLAGSYSLTIAGKGADGTTHQTTVTLVVNAPNNAPKPDFTLAAPPSSLTVQRGRSGSYQVSVTASNGYTQNVTLSESGQSGGVTATFSANPITPASPTSVLTITASASAKRTTRTLTITGTGADGTTHSTTVTLVVR